MAYQTQLSGKNKAKKSHIYYLLLSPVECQKVYADCKAPDIFFFFFNLKVLRLFLFLHNICFLGGIRKTSRYNSYLELRKLLLVS